jgi:MtN3 and saliva related transmembrane protein
MLAANPVSMWVIPFSSPTFMALPPLNGLANIVGTLAAILTTLAFLPQAWLTWKTRRAEGVSLGMYTLFTVGVTLWFVYGLLLGAWPIIIANFTTLVLALFILGMKLRFG